VKILVVDVGGNNVKVLASGHHSPRKFPSGLDLTPARRVAGVKEAANGWRWDVVSIGLPAPIRNGRPADEPKNLGTGWLRYDYRRAFGRPVRMINDAAMQALGSYAGGRMLFLGLGTGLGSAMIVDGILEPMELGHLPFRKATYEDYVGERGRERLGDKHWRKAVVETIETLSAGLLPDYVVVGGGNAERLDELPPSCRHGHNEAAFLGGFRLWLDQA
jgi:polyphosphate glucokinase